jgi:predicted transport protein
MESAMIKNLPKKTGKTLEEWIRLLKSKGPKGRNAQMNWLKKTKGLGHFQADTIIKRMENPHSEYEDIDSIMRILFKGNNYKTKGIYEHLKQKIIKLGPDVKEKISKSYISYYRKKQFLIVKPYKGSLTLGFSLPEDFRHKLLSPAGTSLGGSSRIRYKLVVNKKNDINADVLALIRAAYKIN